jgi:tRNA 2-selenouridine synthase
MQLITAQHALAQLDAFDALIDARSESEFAEDHLPGAVNWPVLNDAERKLVGTEYKQISAFDARKRGAVLVSRNIARHIETQVMDQPKSWRPLVYCWRGGNRSGALATVLDRIGFRVSVLEGGYREYRRAVIAQLQTLPQRFTYKVVCGKTGSGKTHYLHQLRERGEQVLDLEGLANHRGSVLGLKPGDVQPSQKLFETRIWHALRSFDAARPVYAESESRKVGAVQVPDALIQAMRASECIVLEVPIEQRVEFLLKEYDFFVRDPQALHARLDALIALRGRETIERWKRWTTPPISDESLRRFVRESLELHYDPMYLASMRRNFARFGQR